jgi:hypothetical protein
MNTTTCRACGAQIGFIKTVSGKSMPVDADSLRFQPDPNGKELFVLADGTTERGSTENADGPDTMIGFISHFATCTNPDFFRKPRKSTRKK